MADSRVFLAGSLCGLVVSSLVSVSAQGAAEGASGLEEVFVTAQRREELSRDVPITITALSADALESAGANQLTDISRVTPSLRFDSAATFVQPTIRGVGTAVVNVGGAGNVGIYVDGFYSPNPAASDFDLLSLSSIQVLKGPQGTLFGRNTTGGAILVSTREPSREPGAEFKATYGRFDAVKVQSYATAGLGDPVAMDIAGVYRSGNGYVHNLFTGSKRDGEYENWAVRTGLKFEPSDGVSLLLRYSHSDTDDPTMMNTNIYHDPAFGVGTNLPASTYTDRPGSVTLNDPAESLGESDVVQLTGKFDLGFADLTSYTQYRDEQTRMLEDLDHTSVKIFHIHILVDDETVSQEFLLTSKPGSRLQWTTGLFYLRYKDGFATRIGTATPTDRFSSLALLRLGTTTKTIAGFADVTYELTPKLFLTAGARYAEDTTGDPYFAFPQIGVENPVLTHVEDLKGSKVTPRAVLRYKPTDDSSVYASFSKGYKAGLIDFGAFNRNAVKPENINAFEVGYKYDDRALAIDLSAFYYDYKNLQVSLYKGANATAEVINATDSEVYGLEGQIRYRTTARFEVNAGASYTHARYKDFSNAPVYTRCTSPDCAAVGVSFIVVPTPLNDATMQRAPEFTGNVGGRYTLGLAGGDLALSGNLYYTSKFYFGPSGVQFPQKAYEVLALRAEWTDASGRFSFGIFGDNVTDSRYKTQVQYNSFGIGSVWSSPAVWGVQVGAKF